ncbi:MAG: HD domain-containing protein [Planctomycetota bacterium]|jgi:HD superfamily phosphodiesterase|nr:HD domain-containing protein [Planctomycetota bacterium]
MLTDDILAVAMSYNGNDVKRINHLLKVFSFAHHIGVMEKCGTEMQTIVDISAMLHDIGIHEAERKHDSNAGNWQELEGPPVARELLKDFHLDAFVEERILFLIGHHHHYNSIDGIDFQIVIEADFLVNIFEGGMDRRSIEKIRENIFKTESGTGLLDKLYG